MATATITQIINQVKLLPQEEQREVLDQLVELVHKRDDKPRPRITEIEGLGAEIWHGLSVNDYINQERDSWDGSAAD